MQTNWSSKHPNYIPYWRDWHIYVAVTSKTKEGYELAIESAQTFEDLYTKKDLKSIHGWEGDK